MVSQTVNVYKSVYQVFRSVYSVLVYDRYSNAIISPWLEIGRESTWTNG